MRSFTALLFALFLATAPANAWIHGASSSFNGGRSQMNVSQLGFACCDFINKVKTASNWQYAATGSQGPQGGFIDPQYLDSNGYPTAIQTSGYFQVPIIPSQAERPGNIVIRWIGNGTIQTPNGTFVSGSLTSTLGGDGIYRGRYVYTPGASNIRIGVTSMGSPYVSKIEALYTDEEAAYDLGAVFSPDFINKLRSTLRVGKIRFLDWQGSSTGANGSNVTTWATLKGEDYFSYAATEWKPSLYAGPTSNGSNPITDATGSVNDYTISFGSGDWTDKQTIQLKFNATATTAPSAVTVSGTVGSGDLVINWPSHGLSSQAPIGCYGTTGGAIFPKPLSFSTTAYVGTVVDANSFKVSLTPGGADVIRETAGNGSLSCLRLPTLALNGNAPVAIKNSYGSVGTITGSSGDTPVANDYATLVYDADLKSLLLFRGSENGIVNGVPPSIMLRLCKEVGAHCYFLTPFLAADPMTDYVRELATACRDYAASNAPWMKCSIEGPNETWNFQTGFLATLYAWNKAYAHWGTAAFDEYNWYGKVISTIGQDVQSVFSGDTTKYDVILGVRASSGDGVTTNDTRMNSTAYVAQSAPAQSGYVKEPAYKYATHIAPAIYIGPGSYTYPEELAWAYDYVVNGNASALSSYMATYEGAAKGGNLAKGAARYAALGTYAAGPWGGSYVLGMQSYEGGIGIINATGSSTGVITGATQANPVVLTISTSTISPGSAGAQSNSPSPAAFPGMILRVSSVGGMTQLNSGAAQSVTITSGNANIPYTGTASVGQGVNFTAANTSSTLPSNLTNGVTYYIVSVNAGVSIQVSATKGGGAITPSGGSGTTTVEPGWVVTSVSGTSTTIDVDGSGFSAYTSGGAVTYINAIPFLLAFREAARMSPAMEGYTYGGAVSNYQNFLNATGASWPSQYYLMASSSSTFGLYQPSLYSTPSPAAAGITTFNYP